MYNGSLLTLARPYAKAIFEFAHEHYMVEKWELMLVCVKNIIQNPVVKKFLFIVNYIEPLELASIIISISQHKLDCFCQNFIQVLAEYKRLYLIPTILNEFLSLKRRKEMLVKIKIVTSTLLNDNELLKITSVIEEKLSCKVNIIYELDRSIIGGIIFYINDLVIDGSIRGCIHRLKKSVLEI